MINEQSAWSSAGRLAPPRAELYSFRSSSRPAKKKRFNAEASAHRANTAEAHQLMVERVISYMRAHLDELLTLDHLAGVGRASKFHLVRIFEEISGASPHQFLTWLRLRRAQELLLNSNRSIMDVCLEVGYSSHGSFSRIFSCFVGISPTAFRYSRGFPRLGFA